MTVKCSRVGLDVLRPLAACLVIVSLLSITGCASSDKSANEQPGVSELRGNSSAPAVSSTQTSEQTIPPNIDLAYVTQVLNELEKPRTEVIRDWSQQKHFTPDSETKVRAVYTDPLLSDMLRQFRSPVPAIPKDAKSVPSAQVWEVKHLNSASSSCIDAKAVIDVSPLYTTSHPKIESEVVLRPKPHDRSINPTPWMIADQYPHQLSRERTCES